VRALRGALPGRGGGLRPPTPYAELNRVLAELAGTSSSILGADFVGAYLQGSFALGAGDEHSDCDFIVVVRRSPSPEQERRLRAFHRDLPHRDGFWNRHLEGSYAVREELRSVEGLGREWLYVDHGWDEMQWSDHCNQAWTRWILRERGIALAGPRPVEVVDPVPPGVLRERARATLPTLVDDLGGWCPPDIAWCQRYLVTQAARSLHTVRTARVASKAAALEWAKVELEERWRPLLEQVLADRSRGFDPHEPPRPGSLTQARAFAAHAAAVAARQ
jgi:hypothetical protein